jgi:hypothetical protein
MATKRGKEFKVLFDVGDILGTQITARTALSSEVSLCSCVMQNTIKDLRRPADHKDHISALFWVEDTGVQPWGFSWVCDHIQVPAEDARKRILVWVKEGCPKPRRCKTKDCTNVERYKGLCATCYNKKLQTLKMVA